MHRLRAFADLIIRCFLAVAMVALFVMMMVTVSDVSMRYVFNAPIVGAYDLVEICLVVSVFFSLGAVISGLHEIVIDIIDQLVSPRLVTLLQRVAALLSAIVLVFILISMLTPALQAYQYGDIRLELNLPVWIIWVIALTGLCGGVLAALLNLVRHVAKPGIANGVS